VLTDVNLTVRAGEVAAIIGVRNMPRAYLKYLTYFRYS